MFQRSHWLVGGAIGVVLCLLFLYSRRNKPAPTARPPWPVRKEFAPPPSLPPPTVVTVETPPLASPSSLAEVPPLPPPVDPAFVPRTPAGETLDPFVVAPPVQPRVRLEQNLVALDERPIATDTLRGIIRLKSNESLWLLAERAYGSGLYAKALFEHNRQRIARPDQLHEGDELDLPEPGDLAQEFPTLVPRSDDRFRP